MVAKEPIFDRIIPELTRLALVAVVRYFLIAELPTTEDMVDI